MKKLTWKSMSAREKDAAVAEHLFGYRWRAYEAVKGRPKKLIVLHDGIPGLWEKSEGPETNNGYERFSDWDRFVPLYTTDPAALAKVKERFGEWLIEKNGDNMEVFIFTENTRYHGEAPTEAEAFCIAALRAKGMEVEA